MSKQDIEQKNSPSFWKPTSLDNLIEQQGITPINNLDENSSFYRILCLKLLPPNEEAIKKL